MYDVPSERHVQLPLFGQSLCRPREHYIEAPEEQPRDQDKAQHHEGRHSGFLATRPDNFAQLDPRQRDELLEIGAVLRERNDDGAEREAGNHRQPTQPYRLVAEQVEAGDARNHEKDRDYELHGIRRAAVLSFNVFCHINRWQARRESNPQPAVLETAALPIELLA